MKKLIALILLIHFTPKFCHSQTDGFQIANIHSKLDNRWAVEMEPKVALEEIFDQTFTYMAAGGQCYVFASEDGKYVVKFFKHHLRRVSPIIEALPLWGTMAERRTIHRAKREKKLLRDFESYRLVAREFSEETGLVFVHLSKGDLPNLKAHIIDKIGIAHNIDLNEVEFIVQKRATLAYEYMDPLSLEEKRQAITSIVELVKGRCSKGIYDGDAKIHRNFGFIDGKAVLIDVGRLKKDLSRKDPEVQKIDLEKVTRPLRERYPELIHHLEEVIS